jgi:hypothetical protein
MGLGWRAAGVALTATLAAVPPLVTAVDLPGLPIACVLAASDSVVLGRVGADAAGGYWVDVEQVVTGDQLSGRLRFGVSPWQGPANQPAGPALLFLRRLAGRSDWEVVGPSAEGWRAMTAGKVLLPGLTVPSPATAGEQWYASSEAASALRAASECVRWTRDPARGRMNAILVCDAARLAAVKSESAIAEALLATAERIASAGGAPCPALGGRPPS